MGPCVRRDDASIDVCRRFNFQTPRVNGHAFAFSVARKLSANRLSPDIGVPSGRITDILNGRRAITADSAVRLGRYFGNSAQFWLDLQGQYDIGVVEGGEGRRDRQAGQAGGCGMKRPVDGRDHFPARDVPVMFRFLEVRSWSQ
jgi:addiction module HigA family antidote